MWSDKKNINLLINTLLFLLGLNFLYIGQFLLPIICLIILVENKMHFYVNNKYIFLLLCVFSVTYWFFSIDLGLYGLIGFCLPMCYYIGSNLKDKSKFRYVLYLLSLGMAFHLIINMVYEMYIYDLDIMHIFSKANHYDFWLKDKVNSTLTALNSVFFIGIMYYVIFYEDDKYVRYISIIVYLLALFYCFALGRRTTPALLIISFTFSYTIDFCFIKKNSISSKTIISFIISIIAFIFLIILLIKNNILGITDKISKTMLFYKITTQGLNSGRLSILLEAIKIAPNHLWGGREILNELGSFVHDLWGDIYDYAGIIPYILMIIISVICVKSVLSFIFNNNVDKKTKILVIPWFVCVCLISFIEPLMSGGTIFLFASAVILSAIGTINS